MGKVKVTLLIDESVVQKAKEIGLNLSITAERALKEAIERLEGRKTETDCEKPNCMEPREGFEPSTNSLQG